MHTPRTTLLTSTLIALGLCVGCDQLSESLDVDIVTDYTFPAAIDVGAVTGGTAGTVAPAQVSKDLAVPAQDVDLVKEAPALKDAKGRVKSIELTKISALPKTNTVTGVLPAFDIYIGALGNTDVKNAFKIATIPAIPAGSNTVVNATIDAEGTKSAQQFLTTLAFSQMLVAKLVVEKGESIPGGEADLNVTLGLKAVLNPVK